MSSSGPSSASPNASGPRCCSPSSTTFPGSSLPPRSGVSHVAARALLTRARESLRQALAAERKAELDAEALAEQRVAEKRDSDAGRRLGR